MGTILQTLCLHPKSCFNVLLIVVIKCVCHNLHVHYNKFCHDDDSFSKFSLSSLICLLVYVKDHGTIGK